MSHYLDALKACENSYVLAFITKWEDFKSPVWYKFYACVMNLAIVLDGRNILDN